VGVERLIIEFVVDFPNQTESETTQMNNLEQEDESQKRKNGYSEKNFSERK